EFALRTAGPVDAGGLSAGIDPAVAADLAGVAAQIDGSRGHVDEPFGTAAVERHLDNSLAVDKSAGRRSTRLDEFGLALHSDGFGDSADLQRNVLGGREVDGEMDAGLDISGEPGSFDAQLIVADRQAREQECAGRIARDSLCEASLHVANRNLRFRNRRSTGIADLAGQTGCGELGW